MISTQNRKYFNIMLHVFSWLLFAFVLLFYQPFSWNVNLPTAFWIKQGFILMVLIIIFYLNSYILVPKLLLNNKTVTFLLCLAAIAIFTAPLVKVVDNALDLPELMSIVFNKQGMARPPRKKDFIDLFLLMMTLLMLGISTSVTLIQKWQIDKLGREELEKEKIGSELSFLKAQINPHFFFNTLNNIYALTHVNVEDSRSALHKLSRMMRYLLYETKPGSTPLSKEIGFIVDFIELMKLRLNDFTKVNFVPPVINSDPSIAAMLFLPFIENAFKYGVSTTEASEISIEIELTGNKLNLSVKNSIFNYDTEGTNPYGGIGLSNTRRRLELLYPSRHTLTADTSEDQHEFIVKLELILNDTEMHSS